MILFFTLIMHCVTFADVGDVQFLKSTCLKKHIKNTANNKICECYEKNIKARLDESFMKVLVKSKKKLSIDKELKEMEGITTIFHYEANVDSECSKNPNWFVGPEDKGEPDDN